MIKKLVAAKIFAWLEERGKVVRRGSEKESLEEGKKWGNLLANGRKTINNDRERDPIESH